MLKLEMNKKEKTAIIIVNSDLSGETNENLSDTLQEVFQNGIFSLKISMDGAKTINSNGLGILIGAHAKTKSNGGKLCLTNVSDGLFDFLESVNLNRELAISRNENDS